jgi:hypothetical protein
MDYCLLKETFDSLLMVCVFPRTLHGKAIEWFNFLHDHSIFGWKHSFDLFKARFGDLRPKFSPSSILPWCDFFSEHLDLHTYDKFIDAKKNSMINR